MAYRSGPPRGGHIEGLDELEAKLRRGVRRRRLVMGFLALVTGIGMVVTGTMMCLTHARMLRIAIAMVLFGLLLGVLAFVILRVGELRESDGLEVHEHDPIPWSTLGLVSAGILVVIGAIAAYPLGLYRWIDSLRSPCRSVFTPKDAAAMGLSPFAMGRIENASRTCTMSGTSGDRRVVQVTLSAYDGVRYDRDPRTPLTLGDESYLVERAGESIVYVRRRNATMLVHLSSRHFDHDAAMKIAKHLEAKVPLLDRYADTGR